MYLFLVFLAFTAILKKHFLLMNNFGKYFFFENDIKHFVSTLLEVANVN
jgi:hypothetical protein